MKSYSPTFCVCVCVCAGPDGGHTHRGGGAGQGELRGGGHQPVEHARRRLAPPVAAQVAQH